MSYLAVRDYDGAGVKLPGIECAPSNPKGTLYFIYGISAKVADYGNLIEPLGRQFKVRAFEQRGHCYAPGKFDPKKMADDLESVIESDSGPVGIIGHSLGCRAAVDAASRLEKKGTPVQGIYMLEPYLGMEFAGALPRFATSLAWFLSLPLWPVDKLFNEMESARQKLGFHNRDVIASFGKLAKVSVKDCGACTAPVSYVLTKNDEALGTASNKHYEACVRYMRELLPQSHDDTTPHIAQWNHCFNLNRNDFRPFFKPESEKESKQALGRIRAFFESIFEKH